MLSLSRITALPPHYTLHITQPSYFTIYFTIYITHHPNECQMNVKKNNVTRWMPPDKCHQMDATSLHNHSSPGQMPRTEAPAAEQSLCWSLAQWIPTEAAIRPQNHTTRIPIASWPGVDLPGFCFLISTSCCFGQQIINRPGVAGAVLQTPPSFIN